MFDLNTLEQELVILQLNQSWDTRSSADRIQWLRHAGLLENGEQWPGSKFHKWIIENKPGVHQPLRWIPPTQRITLEDILYYAKTQIL